MILNKYSCSPKDVCHGSQFDVAFTFGNNKHHSMNCHEQFPLGMTESSNESFTEGEAPTKVEGTKENVVPKDKEIRWEFVDDVKKLGLRKYHYKHQMSHVKLCCIVRWRAMNPKSNWLP